MAMEFPMIIMTMTMTMLLTMRMKKKMGIVTWMASPGLTSSRRSANKSIIRLCKEIHCRMYLNLLE